MSNQVNTNLLERASVCMDYFESKLPAQIIEADLKRNDLEALEVHVKEAENMIFEAEYRPEHTEMTDERAEAMLEATDVY
tara:strand:+ start:253 stop:492 length:240 start_codon:yes stop_codon:yes gene_type:complete